MQNENIFDFPSIEDSNLFSVEEKKHLQQRRVQLENEIKDLEENLFRLSRIKKENTESRIGRGELSVMFAETKNFVSESNSEQITEMIEDFSNNIKKSCDLTAQFQVIVQDIREEEQKRQLYLEELDSLRSAFDFSDIQMVVPAMKNHKKVDIRTEMQIVQEYEHEKLQTTNSIIKLMKNKASSYHYDCINSLTNSIDNLIKVNTLGTSYIKSEVERMNIFLKQIESSNIQCSQQVSSLKSKLNGVLADTEATMRIKKTEIDAIREKTLQSIEEMDNTINELEIQISDFGESVSNCEKEMKYMINNIMDESAENDFAFTEEEEAAIFNFSDEVEGTDEEFQLIEKRNTLRQQIAQSQKDYEQMKKIVIEREQRREKEINELKLMYKNMKRKK